MGWLNMPRKKKDINIEIGKRLREIRVNNGYTQERISEILGVGVEHYRKLESGLHGLQPDKMLILYQECKIDPTYLITGERNRDFDLDYFLANSDAKKRSECIEQIISFIRRIMMDNQKRI